MPAHTLQVSITRTNGQAFNRTVPVSIVHGMVSMGGYWVPGIAIQPEDFVAKFPEFKPSAMEWLCQCIEYGINEGEEYQGYRMGWDLNAMDSDTPEDIVTVHHILSPFTVECLEEAEGQAIADADGETN